MAHILDYVRRERELGSKCESLVSSPDCQYNDFYPNFLLWVTWPRQTLSPLVAFTRVFYHSSKKSNYDWNQPLSWWQATTEKEEHDTAMMMSSQLQKTAMGKTDDKNQINNCWFINLY